MLLEQLEFADAQGVDLEIADLQGGDLRLIDGERADDEAADSQSSDRQGADGNGTDGQGSGRYRAGGELLEFGFIGAVFAEEAHTFIISQGPRMAQPHAAGTYTRRVRRTILAFALAAMPALAASLVLRVAIDGPVHPVTAEIVGDAVAQAREQGAQLILIRLNTPGGLLDATREIVEKIVFLLFPWWLMCAPSGGRAASAGFYILEAADIAAMAPGTNTGAASPVLMGQTMDPVLRSKMENDLAALLRSFTARRGRNSELAEKAVREAKAFSDIKR